MLLGLLSVLLQGALASQAGTTDQEPTMLDPARTVMVEAGVEWCAPVGGAPATALLVCSKKAQLDLIDLQAGRDSFAEPITVQPGTRFAGAAGRVAYVCGPSRVYAFLAGGANEVGGEKPGLLWQVAGAPAAETAGDPEFLTRIIAAKATPSGVMIVRSDGRVAELDRKDGRLRWQHKLPTLGHCRLHVRGAKAAAVWKQGVFFKVTFFDLGRESVTPATFAVEHTPPIWTTLVDEGLVAVWNREFALIKENGQHRFYDLHSGDVATASSVAVYASMKDSGHDDGVGQPPGPLLLLGSKHVNAYEVLTGRLRWSSQESTEMFPSETLEPYVPLRVSGELIVRTGVCWFSVSRAGGEDRGGAAHGRRSSAIDAGADDGFAYGLFWGGFARGKQKDPQRLILVRKIMENTPWPRPGEPVDPMPREYRLGEAELIRDTFWIGGTLVVVEDKRLRAYTLP